MNASSKVRPRESTEDRRQDTTIRAVPCVSKEVTPSECTYNRAQEPHDLSYDHSNQRYSYNKNFRVKITPIKLTQEIEFRFMARNLFICILIDFLFVMHLI